MTAAVEPLLRVSEDVLTSSKVRKAARAAIAAIQSRVTVGEQGGLTLAEGSVVGGELSVTEDAGGLEVAEEEEASTDESAAH